MLNMNKVRKNIVIQGLGFVGSAMAIAVASKLNDDGKPIYDITGVDLPSGPGQERIDSINEGRFPFATNDKTLNNELQKIENFSKRILTII